MSFAGLINAADALGGVYLNFPYPSWDPYSGLRILHPGCQIVQGFQALALTRSRHFYYNNIHAKFFPRTTASDSELYDAGWVYDGTSDFGRIDRQNAFLRAMVDQAKKLYNPLTILHFLAALPQGITLDSTITLHELVGLAVRFHSINANSIQTYNVADDFGRERRTRRRALRGSASRPATVGQHFWQRADRSNEPSAGH